MIQNSNQRLEAVLQAVPDLLFEMDLEGRYLNVWGGNQDLLTAPESHLIGRTVEEMLPAREAQEILAALAEADKSGRSAGHQIQLILPHGACWFELSVAKQAANKLHGVSFIVLSRDITSRKQAEDEIRNLAFYDALTKLPNRRLLLDRLRSALTASSRSKMYGAVLFLDLDRFKILNDTLGHDYGDLLLIEVAKRLQSCMREIDTVARLGGDEFVVLIEEIDEQADNASQKIALIAEKIRSSLSAPYILNSSAHYSSPSIGVCLYQGSEESLDVILKRADMAMYRAKESGRNAIRFFDPACSKE